MESNLRYTRIETPRHTFVFDSQLQELIVTLPGWPPLRFFDVSECYALQDVLSALPARTVATNRLPSPLDD